VDKAGCQRQLMPAEDEQETQTDDAAQEAERLLPTQAVHQSFGPSLGDGQEDIAGRQRPLIPAGDEQDAQANDTEEEPIVEDNAHDKNQLGARELQVGAVAAPRRKGKSQVATAVVLSLGLVALGTVWSSGPFGSTPKTRAAVASTPLDADGVAAEVESHIALPSFPCERDEDGAMCKITSNHFPPDGLYGNESEHTWQVVFPGPMNVRENRPWSPPSSTADGVAPPLRAAARRVIGSG
jgi:hypothetical protein